MKISKVWHFLGTVSKSKKGSVQSKLVRPSSLMLVALVKEIGWQVLALSTSQSPAKLVPRLKMIFRFAVHVNRFARFNGDLAAAKYLKAALLALQRRLAGQPVHSLRELEPDLPLLRLATCGLPRIIGTIDRRLILRGNQATITLWISLLSLYRIFECPVQAKVKTITAPFSGDQSFLEGFEKFVPQGIGIFKGFIESLDLKRMGLLPITKASPISSVSFMSLRRSFWALEVFGLLPTLKEYLIETGNGYLHSELTYLEAIYRRSPPKLDSEYLTDLEIGKLSPKVEAAGKLRIFAMVDIWTQSALYPLHLWLFDILRKLPNDGTFNQEAAVERGWDKAKASSCSFGYDLSAATDRLPLSLQCAILSSFLGPKVSALWASLLVSRRYAVSSGNQKKYCLDPFYKYAVGQPMGAYSSWAMLAITHHYIVQCAAMHSGKSNGTWFTGYELLGDDIILFDKDVAAVYLQIMQGLGVDINLTKSVVDTKGRVTEFAKRTAVKGKDVSAVSWGALRALQDKASRLTYALSLSVRTKSALVSRISVMISANLGMLAHVTNLQRERALSLIMSRVLSEGPGAWQLWIPFLISKDGAGWVSNRVLRFPLGFSARVLTAASLRQEVELVPPSFQTYIYRMYKRSLEWAIRARIIKLLPRVKKTLLQLPDKWEILVCSDLSKQEMTVLLHSQIWKYINTFRVACGDVAVDQVWQPYLYGLQDDPVYGGWNCLKAAIEDSFFDVTIVQTLPIETCYRILDVLDNLQTVSAFPRQVKDKIDRKSRNVDVDTSSLAVKILAEMRSLRAQSPYGVGPIGNKSWPRYGGKGGERRVTSKVA